MAVFRTVLQRLRFWWWYLYLRKPPQDEQDEIDLDHMAW